MLTVKWAYEAGGISRERVFEADTVDVAYDNRTPNKPDCPTALTPGKLGIYHVPSHGVVVIGDSSDGANSMAFAFGRVYVMNREGATVGTYRLSREPIGFSVDAAGEKSVPAAA